MIADARCQAASTCHHHKRQCERGAYAPAWLVVHHLRQEFSWRVLLTRSGSCDLILHIRDYRCRNRVLTIASTSQESFTGAGRGGLARAFVLCVWLAPVLGTRQVVCSRQKLQLQAL